MILKSAALPALFAAALTLSGAGAVQAQELIDGTATTEILNIARGYGAANLETRDNGAPMITGKIDGVTYQVYFLNCDDSGANCEDINFYAGFLDNKQPLDLINAWNRDKRFGKAYLDSDLDAVLEFDVNLDYGVTPKNLDSAFSLWNLVLGQYVEYIGHK